MARATVEGAAQQRLERRMAHQEPTIEDTRKLLEANLFHHELITEDELALRHARSIGQAFDAFVARNRKPNSAPAKEPKTPMWQRLTEVQVPLLLIFGREDRAKAADRAKLLKEKSPSSTSTSSPTANISSPGTPPTNSSASPSRS